MRLDIDHAVIIVTIRTRFMLYLYITYNIIMFIFLPTSYRILGKV